MRRNPREPAESGKVSPAGKAKRKPTKAGKSRLDVLLVDRGLAPSRERGQALLLAGQIRVNGIPAAKAGMLVAMDARIEIAGEPLRYASRGGVKLDGAMEDFAVSAEGRVCLDAGSSTGGFTDCLLQRGARKVYAVDVTTSQLDWRLQRDPRVVQVERNARYLRREDIGETVDLITMDLSFISAAKVLAAIVPLAAPEAEFLILVKPQFELDRGQVGKGGIVRDPELHREAIRRVSAAAEAAGLCVSAVKPSRIAGAEGNQEFFLHARLRPLE